MKKILLLWMALLPLVAAQARMKLPKKAPKHVVIIGFDGLSAQSIREADAMPFYEKKMADGMSTLRSRSILPSSSACNWASLFMGAGPEQHGYFTWNSRKPDFPSDTLTNHGIFPDLYYTIRQTYPDAKIAHFYEWIGIHYVVDTLSVSKDMQIDHKKPEQMQAMYDYIVQEKPLVTSIIFDSPDNVGHASGWMTPEYLACESEIDKELQKVFQCVERAGILAETLFIFVADHGGTGQQHGGTSMQEMETCVVFTGYGIKPGGKIAETSSIMDITPTISALLGLKRPHAWVGRPYPSVIGRK